jgi:hypothetical protein
MNQTGIPMNQSNIIKLTTYYTQLWIKDTKIQKHNPDLQKFLKQATYPACDISNQINSLVIKSNDNRKRYDLEEVQIKSAIENLQNKCHHEIHSYQPDPSGNNDDSNTCDICGWEW